MEDKAAVKNNLLVMVWKIVSSWCSVKKGDEQCASVIPLLFC